MRVTELQKALFERVEAAAGSAAGGCTTAEILALYRYNDESKVRRSLEGLVATGHLSRQGDTWRIKTPDQQLQLDIPPGAERKR